MPRLRRRRGVARITIEIELNGAFPGVCRKDIFMGIIPCTRDYFLMGPSSSSIEVRLH